MMIWSSLCWCIEKKTHSMIQTDYVNYPIYMINWLCETFDCEILEQFFQKHSRFTVVNYFRKTFCSNKDQQKKKGCKFRFYSNLFDLKSIKQENKQKERTETFPQNLISDFSNHIWYIYCESFFLFTLFTISCHHHHHHIDINRTNTKEIYFNYDSRWWCYQHSKYRTKKKPTTTTDRQTNKQINKSVE